MVTKINMIINEILARQHYPESLMESINYFRNISFEIDKDPSLIKNHLNFFSIKACAEDRQSSCFERTKRIEALSYGDPGVLLACPGPSLSGLMVRELGNSEQKEQFFSYISEKLSTTFLAVTEPSKGSDAGKMQTILKKQGVDDYQLFGEKYLVGHGANAPLGVVVARLSRGPLGIIAVLLTPDILSSHYPSLHRKHLNTVGLRGARLSHLTFSGLKIKDHHVLGLHLSPTQRGMMAVIKTFNRMRPGVAAFAVGHAQAIIDYAKTNFHFSHDQKNSITALNTELMSVRMMLYDAAKAIDDDPMKGGYASSAKKKSTELIEKIFSTLFFLFLLKSLIIHFF